MWKINHKKTLIFLLMVSIVFFSVSGWNLFASERQATISKLKGDGT